MNNRNDIKKIVLIMTQSCNLNCSYCYENHKSGKIMTFECAKKIIDSEMKYIIEDTIITIEFFGGEPFLCFETIKEIVNYVDEFYAERKVHYSATTNGTLVKNAIKDYLKENAYRFDIALSLDGTKEMHDINRPYKNGKGSFDDIDLTFFLNTYKPARAKMTVSKETLPMLYEGIVFLQNSGFQPVADLAAADYWDNDDYVVFEGEIQKLVDYYSKNVEFDICRMLDYDLRRVFIGKDAHFQYCGAGKNMVTYDVDGTWYPCMALAPVSQGDDAVRFAKEGFEDFKLSNNNICKECSLLRLCRNCYAANYNQTGSIERQTSIQCKLNRVTILASALIQFNRICLKYADKSKKIIHEDELVLKAIMRIQNIITKEENQFL